MTPSARLAAAIDILAALEQTPIPADRVVREFFRARRYAGSKDRAAVAERVFAVLRRRYSYAWRMSSDAPRALVIASLLAEGAAPEEFFTGLAYAPAALAADELAAIASAPAAPPLSAQGEFPEWLQPELAKAFGGDLLDEMTAMLSRAPVDLRVNTLKTTRDALAAALEAEGFPAEPMAWSPWGLRLSGNVTAKLSASPLFAAGHFEFQDEAAQIAALLCAVKPGERMLDFAAGGGGKSLALAAVLKNKGKIVAHDIDSGRLSMIGPRAKRAGANNISTISAPPPGPFDIVLLDSPCSGTGTWRRQPELRVRLTPARLAELVALQSQLLDQVAGLVAPGGRLVYATCSVLPCEDEEQIAAFLARHSEFAPLPAQDIWAVEAPGNPPPGLEAFFRATPRRTGTDGFFAAVLHRQR
jgi:16S rRNA (cytosine967-C5)-methyltransferase